MTRSIRPYRSAEADVTGRQAWVSRAAWMQHAMHLPHGGEPIGKILQAELADHPVEATVRKRKHLRIGLLPAHLMPRARRGYGEHPRIVVHASDSSGCAHTRCGTSGHGSRSARNVEHRLPLPKLSRIEHHWHPGTEDRGNQVVGVDLRRASCQLPALHLTHARPPFAGNTPQRLRREDSSIRCPSWGCAGAI